MDFATRFARENLDLMRPNGGKYPGVSKEVDWSLVDESESLSESDTVRDNDSLVPADIPAFDGHIALAAKKVRADSADTPPHSIWITLDGDSQKKAHKKTIIRTFMDPTFDIDDGRSHDRLFRVRYFSVGGDSWDWTASTIYSKSTAGAHLLKIQGLFATLVCFNQGSGRFKVSLAILQCTGIKLVNTSPVTYLDTAPVAEISLPDTRYEVSGQILSLVPFDDSKDSSGDICWAWVAQFVAFESAKSKQSTGADAPARMCHLSITVNGCLVLPLALANLRQLTLQEILNVPTTPETQLEMTWVFPNSQLETFGAELLRRVQDDEVRTQIPVYGVVKDGRYPYEATISDGKPYHVPIQVQIDLLRKT
ncbi:hypothetical protein B0H16DRAFT_1738643 [Mycena metata]|uniref:Uncharacterized protein n=1 Tax=Mycena metata TaxID=1033252 RepID=A0AAD7HI62_9AGAR|nr:hypothetical protein B0H16DRAFT_1738643 [Mycena metata]